MPACAPFVTLQMTKDTLVKFCLDSVVTPGDDSLFDSAEWKAWAACRPRSSDLWDLRMRLAAKAQRAIAMTFRIQYDYLRLREVSDARIDFIESAGVVGVHELESQARRCMTQVDVRRNIGISATAPRPPASEDHSPSRRAAPIR